MRLLESLQRKMGSSDYYPKSTEELTLRLIDKTGEKQDLRDQALTTDNLYTSIPLANKLHERNMTLVGTMRPKMVGLRKEVKSLQHRDENSTEVWWEKEKQKITLNSYVFFLLIDLIPI